MLPILERYGVGATCFLTGVSLERPRSFWWERLERALDLGVPNLAELVGMRGARARPTAGELGAFIRQLDSETRAVVDARLAEVAGADPLDAGLRVADVRRLVEAGMEIGFHTLRHDNLVLLREDALASAMEEGKGAWSTQRECLSRSSATPTDTLTSVLRMLLALLDSSRVSPRTMDRRQMATRSGQGGLAPR